MNERNHGENNEGSKNIDVKEKSNDVSMFPPVKYETIHPLSSGFRESSYYNSRRGEVDMLRSGLNYSNTSNANRNSSRSLTESKQGPLGQLLGMTNTNPSEQPQQMLSSPMSHLIKENVMPSSSTRQHVGLINCNSDVEYITEEDLDIRHGIMHELPNVGNNDTQKDLRNKNLPAHIRVNSGRWSIEEHNRFLKGLETHPHGVLNRWRKISTLVASRTVLQTRTHAQKYFRKLLKEGKVLHSKQKTPLVRTQQQYSFPNFGISPDISLQSSNLPQNNVIPSSQRLYYQQQQNSYGIKTSIGDHRLYEKVYPSNVSHHESIFGKRELATSAEESIDWLLNNLETLERVSSAQKVLRNDSHEIGKSNFKSSPYGVHSNSYSNAGTMGMSESFSSLLRQSLPKSKQPTNSSAAASGLLYLQQHHAGSKPLYSLSPRYGARNGSNDPYPLPHQSHTGIFNSTKDLESVWMLTNDSNETSRQHRMSQENIDAPESS